jgi:hypothetical protein
MSEPYFDILGVSRDATDAQLHDGYRRQKAAFQHDPERLRLIEQAYGVLANPMSRKKYVAGLPPVGHGEPPASAEEAIVRPVGTRESTTTADPGLASAGRQKRQKTEFFEPEPAQPARPASSSSMGQTSQPRQEVAPTPTGKRPKTEYFEPEAQPKPTPAAKPHTRQPTAQVEAEETQVSSRPVTAPSEAEVRADQPSARPPYVQVLYEGETQIVNLHPGENVIGRASKDHPPPDIVLVDPHKYISRIHAVITRKGSAYSIVHKGQNPTLLNGNSLDRGSHHPLKNGDVIAIEGREIRLHLA